MATRTTTWWGGGCLVEHFRALSILLRAAGVREGEVTCPCRHATAWGQQIRREGFYTVGPHTDGWPWLVLKLCPACAGAAEMEYTPGCGAEMEMMDERPIKVGYDPWCFRRITWERREETERLQKLASMVSGQSQTWTGPGNRDRMDAMTAQFDASAKMRGAANALNTQTELDLMGAQLRQSIAKHGIIQDRIA